MSLPVILSLYLPCLIDPMPCSSWLSAQQTGPLNLPRWRAQALKARALRHYHTRVIKNERQHRQQHRGE